MASDKDRIPSKPVACLLPATDRPAAAYPGRDGVALRDHARGAARAAEPPKALAPQSDLALHRRAGPRMERPAHPGRPCALSPLRSAALDLCHRQRMRMVLHVMDVDLLGLCQFRFSASSSGSRACGLSAAGKTSVLRPKLAPPDRLDLRPRPLRESPMRTGVGRRRRVKRSCNQEGKDNVTNRCRNRRGADMLSGILRIRQAWVAQAPLPRSADRYQEI